MIGNCSIDGASGCNAIYTNCEPFGVVALCVVGGIRSVTWNSWMGAPGR
jgi:hypothetical protein